MVSGAPEAGSYIHLRRKAMTEQIAVIVVPPLTRGYPLLVTSTGPVGPVVTGKIASDDAEFLGEICASIRAAGYVLSAPSMCRWNLDDLGEPVQDAGKWSVTLCIRKAGEPSHT